MASKILTEHDKKKILRLALFAGEIMLVNGAETYRVEDTILRICHSRNIFHVNAFVTPTAIIIADDRYDGYSFMKIIDARDTNLQKVALVNSFSRDFVNSEIDLDLALKNLKIISEKVAYKVWVRVLWCGIASSSFAGIFGGGFGDLVCAFIISMIASVTALGMFKLDDNAFLSTATSGIVITILALLSISLGIGNNLDMIIAGSIMPLLPGVAFTNGMRDFIAGDLISGMSRAFEAAIIAAAIAVSVVSVLSMYIKLGGII